jgi:hypothetical protein
MFARVAHFLRPTFFAITAFALLVGVRGAIWTADYSARVDPVSDPLAGLGNVDLSGVVLPSPSLLPEQVVRLQLAGLRDVRADGVGVLQCFVLASPGNRAVTGPLERFGKMVRQGPFMCMANPRAALVGRPDVARQTARVVVTIVDQRDRIHAFTFILGRQATAPFADCWMTEAVWPSIPLAGPPDRPAA